MSRAARDECLALPYSSWAWADLHYLPFWEAPKLAEPDLPEVDQRFLLAFFALALAALVDLAFLSARPLVARLVSARVLRPEAAVSSYVSADEIAADAVDAEGDDADTEGLPTLEVLPTLDGLPTPRVRGLTPRTPRTTMPGTPRTPAPRAAAKATPAVALTCEAAVQAQPARCELEEEQEQRLLALRAARAQAWREGRDEGMLCEREQLNEQRRDFEAALLQLRVRLKDVADERNQAQRQLEEQARRFERTAKELSKKSTALDESARKQRHVESMWQQAEARLAKAQVAHQQTKIELKSHEDIECRREVHFSEMEARVERLEGMLHDSETKRKEAEAARRHSVEAMEQEKKRRDDEWSIFVARRAEDASIVGQLEARLRESDAAREQAEAALTDQHATHELADASREALQADHGAALAELRAQLAQTETERRRLEAKNRELLRERDAALRERNSVLRASNEETARAQQARAQNDVHEQMRQKLAQRHARLEKAGGQATTETASRRSTSLGSSQSNSWTSLHEISQDSSTLSSTPFVSPKGGQAPGHRTRVVTA